jgi:hypothetical protein
MNAPGGAHDFLQSISVPRDHADLLLRTIQALSSFGATPLHCSIRPRAMTLHISHMKFQDFAFRESSLPLISNIPILNPMRNDPSSSKVGSTLNLKTTIISSNNLSCSLLDRCLPFFTALLLYDPGL